MLGVRSICKLRGTKYTMKKGFAFIIAAGVLWGSSGVFLNILAPYGFSSLQITAMRLSCAFLILFAYCLVTHREALRATGRELLLCLFSGIALFGTAGCYYAAMQMTSISTAVVLMYISPVPVMIFSVLFLGERLTAKKTVASALMLVGCALVAGIVGDFKPNFVGVLVGLLSGATYAAYNILTKIEVRKGIRPMTATLYTFLFAALSAIVFCRVWELPALVAQKAAFILPIFVVCGLFTCVLPYILYSYSLKVLPVGTASALSIVEPMAASVIGFIVYREAASIFSLCGIALVIFSVLLLGLSESDKKHKNDENNKISEVQNDIEECRMDMER